MPPVPPPQEPARARPKAGRAALAALALVVVGALVLRPVLSGGWLWDDENEVTKNPILSGPAGLEKIWIAPPGPDYFPLKSTVQWLEWRAWGPEPRGYHATSLALHLASALLVWRLLRRLGVRWSRLGGLLFAIHPVAVESVAWAAELKNTLSLPLMLLAMIAYVDHDERTAKGPDPFYWTSLLFFLLAMLAKSSVVMLPVVLLLHAWWKRGRIAGRDWLASAPFFAISLVLGTVTLRFQHRLAIGAWPIGAGGPVDRLARAGLALGFYFSKAVAPVGLSPLYSQGTVAPTLLHILPLAALIALTGWLWARRSSWGRHGLLGLGFFAVNLVPALGLADMSYMRYSWVADHFAYISLIGIAGLAAVALEAFARTAPIPARLAAGIIACLMAWGSNDYARIFHDKKTLWAHALGRDSRSWAAEDNLGDAEMDAGNVQTAIGHYEAAIRLNPEFPEAHSSLGYALMGTGRPAEAVAQLREAVRLGYLKAHTNLGIALAQIGDLAGAINEQREALRAQPDSAEVRVNLGNVLAQAGRLQEALPCYEEALRLQPNFPEGRYNWAIALAGMGRLGDAADQLEQAAREAPGDVKIWNEWGAVLGQAGRLAEARDRFAEAARLAPNFAPAEVNLGNVLLQENRPDEAILHYEKALAIDPRAPGARQNLEYARRLAGRR